MERHDQYTEQKVPSVTVIENTQGDIAVIDDPQDKHSPVDDSEPENDHKDGIFIQLDSLHSNPVPQTPQSSSHNRNGDFPTNSPPHACPLNKCRPNQPNNPAPTIIYENRPCQTIAGGSAGTSPTSVSNNDSLNTTNTTNANTTNTTNATTTTTRNTTIDLSRAVHHHYHMKGNFAVLGPLHNIAWTTIDDDEEDDDAGVNTDQGQECERSAGNGTDIPITPVDLAVSQSLNTPSDLDTLARKPMQASRPLSSTPTTHHNEGLTTTPSLHTGQENSTANTATGVPGVDASSPAADPWLNDAVLRRALPENHLAILNLHPYLRVGLLEEIMGKVDVLDRPPPRHALRTIFVRSVSQLRYLPESIKSSFKSGAQSMISSKPFTSLASLAAMSRATDPDPLRIVKRVPIVPLRGEKKKFPRQVDVYIHAELDPYPGLEPLRLLRDPDISYKRSNGFLPPVYRVNVYDVGYFDGGGRFIVLFNLERTKEENENLLNFRFKTTSFVPLPCALVHSTLLNTKKFQTFADDNIVADLVSHISPREYMARFKVRSNIEKGTAIALLGQVAHDLDSVEVVATYESYFAAQSIEWYRHAKVDRSLKNLENGDLVMITQCYRAPTWGYINYFSGKRTTKDYWAAFQPGMEGQYGWVCETPLKKLETNYHQSSEEDPTAGLADQCIGVRSYSIHCKPEDWRSLCDELKPRRTPNP